MKLGTFFSLLLECLDFLRVQISREKGTIKVYKSYEKKARHDYQKTYDIRLRKNQLIPDSKLLELSDCHSIDDAIKKLEDQLYPDEYVLRIAYIWEYYENVNISSQNV